MNKSKFLKKSLAALLAILMVAAMIPLSAAAATEVIGNGETITVSPGTLAKGDDEYNWTVTLPYNDPDGKTTITLATDRQNVEFFTVAEDGTETTVATGHSAQVPVTDVTVSTPVTKTIVLRTIASDPAEVDALATYTVTVQKEATSADPTITGATVELNSITYTAVVEGDTITFNNIAWGRMPVEGTGGNAGKPVVSSTEVTLKVTMPNKPDATQSGFDVDAAHITNYKVENGVGTGKITAKAQNGNTKVYTVKFNEATSFTGITVAGVAAEQDTEDPTKWTVTVDPEDVDSTAATAGIMVKATAPKRVVNIHVATTSAVTEPTWAASTVQSNGSYKYTTALANDATIYVSIEDNKGNWVENSVVVKHAQNSDTGIKSFAVSDGTYVEQGNVNTMSVTMKNGTTNNSLNKQDASGNSAGEYGMLTVNFNGKIKSVTLNGANMTADLDGSGGALAGDEVKQVTYANFTNNAGTIALSATNANLKVGNNTLVVTAEDGTQKTYNLVVKADSNQTTNPQITGATITLGDDDEEISAKTVDQTNHKIVFEIPASLVDDVDAAAVGAIDWKVSAHSTTDTATPGTSSFARYADANDDAQDVFTTSDGATYTKNDTIYMTDAALYLDNKGANELTDAHHAILVRSDATAADANGVAYKVYINAAPANQSTRLTSIKFYDAESESEVTADNTYEARGNDANYTATLNKTLPYSLYNPGTNDLAVAYEIPARAEIYYTKEVSTGVEHLWKLGKSGFDEKGRVQATITGADLAAAKHIVVVSEAYGANGGTAIVGGSAGSGQTALSALTSNQYVKAYELKMTKADASTLNQLVSLKSANGEVSAVINGYSVNLIVPPTYVVKNSETEFDLVAEVSENASLYKNAYKDSDGNVITANKSDLDDPITFENVKVVENADGTYSLTQSGSISAFAVVAQDGTTLANYTLTVTVAELDDNADISGITADGVAATEGGDGWTVELPYGTDLEAVEVAATAASSKATTAVTKNEDGTYTITVTAERGNIKTYTLTVTVGEEPAAPEFDDVPAWAQEAVGKAAEMGWMVGIGNNKFGPNGNIRRGDFALTIARILEEDWANVSADYAKDVFTDVKAGDWYYEAVAYIAEKGIMNGRANGFDPRTGITREEAAKVICLAKGLEPLEGNTTFIDDASIAGWAKPYVKACQEAGIMNGSSNSVNPKQQLTRAQAAQLFVNAFIDAEPAE